ncbi:hypothetical protein J437_LFUL001014 [Ladona fulva]|uniref:Mutator-like transposase domain-containing protein n=1 Tax=Ladona fulva TaxID=123851 RepID=A0A8K0KFW8_LADFU|nr:hypothetical protein J437_LFUL001014 [Ladona fulva]
MEGDDIREMYQRSDKLHGVKYVNYISDGDSKIYKGVVTESPYGETIAIKKKECINYVQKWIGARLRTCKKGKPGIGGKLTAKLIDSLSNYYGLAIRRNTTSTENMYKAIWTTVYHMSSTDDMPKHHYCPQGADSWCTWQRANAKGPLAQYKHKDALLQIVLDVITPIYEDLSRKELLERCLGDFTQNNNESFSSLVWRIAPKIMPGSAIIV